MGGGGGGGGGGGKRAPPMGSGGVKNNLSRQPSADSALSMADFSADGSAFHDDRDFAGG